ncbi:MAG: hypothetical protein CME32_16960 [Gimesia sp.]|nr:hypothetical protein [Gimesia sp.]
MTCIMDHRFKRIKQETDRETFQQSVPLHHLNQREVSTVSSPDCADLTQKIFVPFVYFVVQKTPDRASPPFSPLTFPQRSPVIE